MLTSSNPNNQYLRPEYLSPLPTTLDAKQSPLALLAQTCSAIGADSPNPKLLANIEKSQKSHIKLSSTEQRDKLSPSGSQSSSLSNSSSSDLPKSSFKPYESCLRDKTTTPEERMSTSSSNQHRIKTPKNQNPTPVNHTHQQMMPINGQVNGRCGSNQSASSPRASPANSVRKTPSSLPEKSASPHSASTKESSSAPPVSTSLESPHNLSSSSLGGNKYTDSLKDSLSKSSMSSIPVSSASYMGYPGGIPYPMDLMTASALMSPHHPMLKAAALNPYLNYARMKVPGGAESMMPVCRDPYCTGCAYGSHMMGKTPSTCPAGCTQCDHPANKAYASQMNNAHNSAAAAYAHAQLAAFAAASQLPYICNWVAGDATYCGKRFSSPEELLQHLRSHTSTMSESMLNPAAAAAGLPPTHPLFQRTYPTPPLSPLSTARYHPYTKPSMLPSSLSQSSLAGLPMPPHPSLAQYFSPYSFYGARLGTPPSMHP